MRGNGGEDARSDEQTDTDVEHRSGEVTSTQGSRENTRSDKEKHKSTEVNKRKKVAKRVIESEHIPLLLRTGQGDMRWEEEVM